MWPPPAWREILDWPLPDQRVGGRLTIRALTLLATRQVRAVHGIENVSPDRDPFILALNHNTMRESFLIPTVVILHRGGRLVHFLSDWNFRLVPGVGTLLRRAGTIPVGVKPPRPAVLNVLKPLFVGSIPGWERARIHLRAGRSVGIFPEATVNRDPHQLLRGRRGMARLSLEESIAVVPAGIQFPENDPDQPIPENAVMELHIGEPMQPPSAGGKPTSAAVGAWHATLMTEIGRLSGKAWRPATNEVSHAPGSTSVHRGTRS